MVCSTFSAKQESAMKIERRIEPYMQTESFPTRSCIETRQALSGQWIITGIYDTEKSAQREVKRREAAEA